MAPAACTSCWSRMTRKRAKGRPTAEEVELWRKVTELVTPMKNRPAPPPAPKPPAPEPSAAARPRPPAKSPNSAPRKAAPAPLESGRLADLDRRTGDRLRRGRMVIDATLDLHGMTQARAHSRLRSFLFQAQARGNRCILVVTGKGRTGPDSGVLRRAVPLWLNEPDLRPMVLAITSAQPQHGGTGALYVLLRRQRHS